MRAGLDHQGVTGFVIGHDGLLFGADDAGLVLTTDHHPVHSVLEVDQRDGVLALACRAERRLVDEIGQVSTDEPGCAGRNLSEIDVWGKCYLLRMHLEDLRPALQVGPVDHRLTIETAGAQQRGVPDLWAIGGCQEHDAFVRIKAIHLGQQLVQGLFPLIVLPIMGLMPRAVTGPHGARGIAPELEYVRVVRRDHRPVVIDLGADHEQAAAIQPLKRRREIREPLASLPKPGAPVGRSPVHQRCWPLVADDSVDRGHVAVARQRDGQDRADMVHKPGSLRLLELRSQARRSGRRAAAPRADRACAREPYPGAIIPRAIACGPSRVE